MPEYVWFNGRIDFTTLDDSVNPAKIVQINTLAGAPDDPKSRIWPVKTLRGKQPIDAEKATLVSASLFGKKDDGFWKTYDWHASIDAAMKAAGRDFSGKVGFVETEMRIPVNHMVAPAEDALSCVSCHSRNGRMKDVKVFIMPGIGSAPILDTLGLDLALLVR